MRGWQVLVRSLGLLALLGAVACDNDTGSVSDGSVDATDSAMGGDAATDASADAATDFCATDPCANGTCTSGATSFSCACDRGTKARPARPTSTTAQRRPA